MRTIRLMTFIDAEGYLIRPNPAAITYMQPYKIQAHFLNSDAILTSGIDYAEIFQRNNGLWPFKQRTYVLATSDGNLTPESPVTFITEHFISNIRNLKQKGNGYISVLACGINSAIISWLLENRLMDEMLFIVLPVKSENMNEDWCFFEQRFSSTEWNITNFSHPGGVTEALYSLNSTRM